MRAGLLKELITIQKVTETLSSTGFPVESWATFVQAYARITPVRGREDLEAQQILATELTRIVIRYVDAVVSNVIVNPKMRVSWADGEGVTRLYDIRSVKVLREEYETVELMCTERIVDVTGS